MNRKSFWLVMVSAVLGLSVGAWFVYALSVTPNLRTTTSHNGQSVPKIENPALPTMQMAASPNAVNLPAKQSLANKFLETKNIDAYLKELRNDPANKIELFLSEAKAIDECAAFGRSPNYAIDRALAIKSLQKGNATIVDKYAGSETERCADFAASRSTRLADAAKLYSDAAQAGSPEASAHEITRELLQPTDAPLADLLSKSIELIHSGDPAAIFELSNAFGENSKFSGMAVGSERAAAAWQLVACDMGLDCSQNSALLAEFCLNGGMYCDGGDLRFNMQNSEFSPTAFAEVIALEDAINAQRESGNINSLFK